MLPPYIGVEMFSDTMSLFVDGSGVWGKCVSTSWNENQSYQH